VEEMLRVEGITDFCALTRTPLDAVFEGQKQDWFGTSNHGSGSGGYAQDVFVHAVRELHGVDIGHDEVGRPALTADGCCMGSFRGLIHLCHYIPFECPFSMS
jgi:hypothetical protein